MRGGPRTSRRAGRTPVAPHPERAFLRPHPGRGKRARPSDARLLAHIGELFIFHRLEDVRDGVATVADYLRACGIAPQSRPGQKLLATFLAQADAQAYGAFARWLTCPYCEEDYPPEVSLAFANRVLAEGTPLCPACLRQGQAAGLAW
jgi:hypothetical protein